MEKNENKFMSKAKSFLVLVLFTIIYIFLQKIISAAFFLFLMAFMISYGNTIEILMIPLIIGLAFVYYFGYLSKDFLGKMNKIGLNTVMIVILIYFLYKAAAGDQNSIIDALIDEKKYIFCILSHVSFIIGVFYSDKVKKILDKIKFKRK